MAERPRTLASRRHWFLQVVVATSGSRQTMAAIPFRFPSSSLLGLLLSHSSLASVRCPSRQKRRTHGLRDSYIHTFIHSYIHTFIHSYSHTVIHSYIHTDIQTYSWCVFSPRAVTRDVWQSRKHRAALY